LARQLTDDRDTLNARLLRRVRPTSQRRLCLLLLLRVRIQKCTAGRRENDGDRREQEGD
jgi:hypothetical protein